MWGYPFCDFVLSTVFSIEMNPWGDGRLTTTMLQWAYLRRGFAPTNIVGADSWATRRLVEKTK